MTTTTLRQQAPRKSVELRAWQRDATRQAVTAFLEKDRRVWVTEACTGAGKTMHGCDTARQLIDNGKADITIVVTPGIGTKAGWKRQLNTVGLHATDDPDQFAVPDYNCLIIAYSGIKGLRDALKIRPVYGGVFLIVDEYHHAEEDASWGQVVNELESLAQCVLMLSGTPWRSSGQIAILARHTNNKGKPYYEGDRVNADYAYTYAEDLGGDDTDRGTVPVEFHFLDSTYTDAKTGTTEALVNPHLRNMPDQERQRWIDDAMKSEIRIGKHLRTQPSSSAVDFQLQSNALVRELIQRGLAGLDRYRLAAGSDLPVAMVVAQSITEARAIYAYVTDVCNRPCSLVVSDKEKASHDVATLQEQCNRRTVHSPDVIVSVGMISEGVDVPQIKVIVFLSAITTLLYFIQLIGRALRRIAIGRTPNGIPKYMDKTVNAMPAQVYALSAPKLIAMASLIEQQIAESGKKSGTGGEGPGPSEYELGTVTTNGDAEIIYRGDAEFAAQCRRGVDAMLSHEKADQCHIDRYWAEWVLTMVLSSKKDAKDEAIRQVQDRCDCLGVSWDSLIGDITEVAGVQLTMEQRHRIASREAESLRHRIRWASPYGDIEDNGEAYRRLNAELNRRCGLRSGFTSASLEAKKDWIVKASAYLQELVA